MEKIMLKISRASWEDIAERIKVSGQHERISQFRVYVGLAPFTLLGIDLGEVTLVVDPEEGA